MMDPGWIILVILTLYCAQVLWYIVGVIKAGRVETEHMPEPGITVLVPFRNEIENLDSLIDGLSHQSLNSKDYSVVLIDDGSTDGSYDKAIALTEPLSNFTVISSDGIGKKDALSTGESYVDEGSIIVTTDADAIVGKCWLETIRARWTHDCDMSINPVMVESDSFAGRLLSVESLSLAGVAVGSAAMGDPVLCSGANLAYRKGLREKLKIRGEEYLSGDDMFLLEACRREKGNVVTSLSSLNTVTTEAPSTIIEFIEQRIRWADKSKGFKDFTILWHGFVVWFTNLVLFISLLVGIFDIPLLKWAIGALVVKGLFDFLFLFLVALRVGKMANLWYFPIVEVLYLPYAALIPLMTLVKKVKWRERLVR